jgi:hypothetical protein
MSKVVYEDLIRRMKGLEEYYGLEEGIRDIYYQKARKVLEASSDVEAGMAAEDVFRRSQDHCIAQWAVGKASGPKTPERLEKQAAKRDSLAKWKYDQGDDEAAKQNEKAAEKLRKEAAKLRRRL